MMLTINPSWYNRTAKQDGNSQATSDNLFSDKAKEAKEPIAV